MWTLSAKQKKTGALIFGAVAIGLFLWLFMRTRNVAAVNALTTVPESAETPAVGNNLYAINFPATQPGSIPGTNIVIGGTTIGSNCGCCDNGTEMIPQGALNQNLAAATTGDDVLLSMIANLQPTGQSDLGYAFG